MAKLVNLVILLIEFYLLVKNSTLFKAHDMWEQELLPVYLYIYCLLYLVLMPCFLLQLFYAEYLLIPFVR